jgi:hypothetical protein
MTDKLDRNATAASAKKRGTQYLLSPGCHEMGHLTNMMSTKNGFF